MRKLPDSFLGINFMLAYMEGTLYIRHIWYKVYPNMAATHLHLYSLTFTCTHSPSLVFNHLHLYALTFTCTHLPSLVRTHLQLYALTFTCTHSPSKSEGECILLIPSGKYSLEYMCAAHLSLLNIILKYYDIEYYNIKYYNINIIILNITSEGECVQVKVSAYK